MLTHIHIYDTYNNNSLQNRGYIAMHAYMHISIYMHMISATEIVY